MARAMRTVQRRSLKKRASAAQYQSHGASDWSTRRKVATTAVAFGLGVALIVILFLGLSSPYASTPPRLSAKTGISDERFSGKQACSASVWELIALPDELLAKVDPLVMNLIVASKLPGMADLDIGRYAKLVDEWAILISRGLAAAEIEAAHNDLAYQYDPDLWRAGGMAVAVAGPHIGISYTAEVLDAGDPIQTFLPGLIDTKTGTCANMPVLYLAIAHRLGWPLRVVVSRDHFWCRWDDGSKQFNLEATSTTSDGQIGSFLSTPDDEYARQLGTPRIAIECGSDFTSLTPRQLLGVFLQTRAAYWAEYDQWDRAEQDLLLARNCFPENRDIYAFLLEAMAHRAGVIFTERERHRLMPLFLSTSTGAEVTLRARRTKKSRPRTPAGDSK